MFRNIRQRQQLGTCTRTPTKLWQGGPHPSNDNPVFRFCGLRQRTERYRFFQPASCDVEEACCSAQSKKRRGPCAQTEADDLCFASIGSVHCPSRPIASMCHSKSSESLIQQIGKQLCSCWWVNLIPKSANTWRSRKLQLAFGRDGQCRDKCNNTGRLVRMKSRAHTCAPSQYETCTPCPRSTMQSTTVTL